MFATRCKGILLSLLFAPLLTNANAIAQSEKTIDIPYMNLPINIDGELDDEIWQHANIVEINTVTSPYENTPSTIKTQAKIIDNGKALAIAFIAHDPDPSKIIASFGKRDTKWFDDIVGISIDPLNNRRITYSFFVNPYGVQNDETYNEITGVANELWDGIWHSFGKLTDTGYQVEMLIPYHLLNFDQTKQIKEWPFELVRIFPREKRLRISSISLDRDNPCWLCQYPKAKGFEHAKTDDNLLLVPSLVASQNEFRDIYDTNANWQKEKNIEASLDLRWGITPKSTLNVTLNPDFSTVEADIGQLSVNKKFSLLYDEKRPFFLENQDYFQSLLNVVYTRNIADPDYGVKFASSENSHNIGGFISHDTETNFILSGNLSARIASLNNESHSGAFRYLYSDDSNASVGIISTFRKADNYHNYVFGVDASYRFSQTDKVKAQLLNSDTQYPLELYQAYCGVHCPESDNQCSLGSCTFNEQVLRSNKQGNFTDKAYTVGYYHNSEHWKGHIQREQLGENFRADLGFINRIDYVDDVIKIGRTLYQDASDSFWSELFAGTEYRIQHNINGELINKENSLLFSIDGPMLSFLELKYTDSNKVGLRRNNGTLALDGNTDRFNEKQLNLYAKARPTNKVFISLEGALGDKIDYDNNRLGDFIEATANVTWTPNQHVELDIYQTYSELDADNANVYKANLTDFRARYYFNVNSSLRFSLVYQNIDYNPKNNPISFYSEKENSLSTQLIYSYKVNPQTVFYLGYSDSSFEDDYLNRLRKEQRSFFSKISYAWR